MVKAKEEDKGVAPVEPRGETQVADAPVEPKAADVPEALRTKEEKQITTTTRTMSEIIKEKLNHLKDLATLEVMLPVENRMRHRLDSIKKMGSAEHIKVRGHWKTKNPAMHISNLQGRKVNNDEVEISFGVYKADAQGNKEEHKNYSNVEVDGRILKKKM